MSEWRIGGASVRGASHARRGKPNQDALLWAPEGGAGRRIVGAVSDGHGASLHFRSDVGARIAVDAAADLVSWHLDDDGADDGDGRLAGEILQLWRSRVDAHLAANPWRPDEPEPVPGAPYVPYGATLVALGATEQQLVMIQIGDGDLLAGFPDGRIERPLRADTGLIGEQTYSLCLDGAERRFRLATMWRAEDRPLPDFILVASDGVSKSFRDEAALDAAILQLRGLALDDWERMLAALPAWLDDISERGSGDDSTACIAVRHAAPARISQGD